MADTVPHGQRGTGYPAFAETLSEEELAAFFYLDEEDVRLVQTKRGEHNRLGFALQLTTVRYLGRFLPDPGDVPGYVVEHVGEQLGIDKPQSVIRRYGERDGTARTHAGEIKAAHGWLDFGQKQEELRAWLHDRAWVTDDGPRTLLIDAVTWLRQKRILLPGFTSLTKLVAGVRQEADQRLHTLLCDLLTDAQCARLDSLLRVRGEQAVSELEQLGRGPGQATWNNLLEALDRAAKVQALGFTAVDVSQVPPRRLAHLARYGLDGKASRVKRHDRRYQRAVALATVKSLEGRALDDALDILNALISNEFIGRARRRTNKERLATYPQLARAAALLKVFTQGVLTASEDQVDATTGEITHLQADPVSLQELIRTIADRPDLEAAVAMIEELVPALDSDTDEARRAEMVKQFDTLQKYLAPLLERVNFGASPEALPVLKALQALPSLLSRQTLGASDIDASLLTGSWRRLVLTNPALADGTVDGKAYAFCVVETFHRMLRRREIFAKGASKWGDLRAMLLSEHAWQEGKSALLNSLGLPECPDHLLTDLTVALDAHLRAVAARLPQDMQVRLGPGGQLLFDKLKPTTEPASLRSLRRTITRMMPTGDLPQVLLEVFKRTDGGSAFTSLTGAPSRSTDLEITLSAVLVAHGCNVGYDLVSGNNAALLRDHIAYVDREYFRPECSEAFNKLMVEQQASIDLAQAWGGGQLASVDGTHFVVPPASVHARISPLGRSEATWLTMVSDQAAGLAGKVVAGTSDKSLYVLDVVHDRHARQQTSSNAGGSDQPDTIVAETGVHEDIAFGLLSLTGYTYAPTPAQLHKTKLWRIDASADYGPLQEATRAQIDLARIERNWEDMLRVVCSIHIGAIRAHDVIRMLTRDGRPTHLGEAFAHFGRIAKTKHLLHLFDDPTFRRRIEDQSQLHLARHELAAKIFHGTTGQIHRYREGMENQLGALGLILNAVVLFNTFYMNQILKRLRDRGRPVLDHDVKRLSPYIHRHINMRGRYAFELPDLTDGMMRPIPEPEDTTDEEPDTADTDTP
ncbi:Tn3 family transposase [Streptomyces griseosporeus]|uniref:Tn3 family transposase n=1 Tax=Streptomyces griseosporeus TaxID=1910 RepID=UPI000721A49D|nr:transposase [Streptomyces hygroscopicus subsp. limoneus]